MGHISLDEVDFRDMSSAETEADRGTPKVFEFDGFEFSPLWSA